VRSSGVAKEPSASRMQWRGKKTAFLRYHSSLLYTTR
jgi:hypothetical protein